jgi:hypothetical protein
MVWEEEKTTGIIQKCTFQERLMKNKVKPIWQFLIDVKDSFENGQPTLDRKELARRKKKKSNTIAILGEIDDTDLLERPNELRKIWEETGTLLDVQIFFNTIVAVRDHCINLQGQLFVPIKEEETAQMFSNSRNVRFQIDIGEEGSLEDRLKKILKKRLQAIGILDELRKVHQEVDYKNTYFTSPQDENVSAFIASISSKTTAEQLELFETLITTQEVFQFFSKEQLKFSLQALALIQDEDIVTAREALKNSQAAMKLIGLLDAPPPEEAPTSEIAQLLVQKGYDAFCLQEKISTLQENVELFRKATDWEVGILVEEVKRLGDTIMKKPLLERGKENKDFELLVFTVNETLNDRSKNQLPDELPGNSSGAGAETTRPPAPWYFKLIIGLLFLTVGYFALSQISPLPLTKRIEATRTEAVSEAVKAETADTSLFCLTDEARKLSVRELVRLFEENQKNWSTKTNFFIEVGLARGWFSAEVKVDPEDNTSGIYLIGPNGRAFPFTKKAFAAVNEKQQQEVANLFATKRRPQIVKTSCSRGNFLRKKTETISEDAAELLNSLD